MVLKRTCRTTHPQLLSGTCVWCDRQIFMGEIIDDSPAGQDQEASEPLFRNSWDFSQMQADLSDPDPQVQGITLCNLRGEQVDTNIGSWPIEKLNEGFLEIYSDYYKFLIKAQSLEPDAFDWPFQLGMLYSRIAVTLETSSRRSLWQKWTAKSFAELKRALEVAPTEAYFHLITQMLAKQAPTAEAYREANQGVEAPLPKANPIKQTAFASERLHCGRPMLDAITRLTNDIEAARAPLSASA